LVVIVKCLIYLLQQVFHDISFGILLGNLDNVDITNADQLTDHPAHTIDHASIYDGAAIAHVEALVWLFVHTIHNMDRARFDYSPYVFNRSTKVPKGGVPSASQF